MARRYETGLPTRGCQITDHVINEQPETAKGKQRVKVSQFFINQGGALTRNLIAGSSFEKVSVKNLIADQTGEFLVCVCLSN